MLIKKSRFFVFFMISLLGLSSCGSITPSPMGKLFERDGVSMVAMPDNMRETYFNDLNSSERHCRAPSSDVSVTASEGVSVGLPGAATSGAGGTALSESAGVGTVALGGRNPAVLITRELMYRACEFTSNFDLPFDKTMQVYERFLQTIEKISVSQTEGGTAAVAAQPPAVITALPSGGGSTNTPRGTIDPWSQKESSTNSASEPTETEE